MLALRKCGSPWFFRTGDCFACGLSKWDRDKMVGLVVPTGSNGKRGMICRKCLLKPAVMWPLLCWAMTAAAGLFGPEVFGVLSKVVLQITLPCAIISSAARRPIDISMLTISFIGFGSSLIYTGLGYPLAWKESRRKKALSISQMFPDIILVAVNSASIIISIVVIVILLVIML